jgi:phage I-like protein
MKVGKYYKEDAKKRKERKTQSAARDKAEVQELRKKLQSLEEKVDDRAVDERIRAVIPMG